MAIDPTSAFQAISTIGSLFGAAQADRERAAALREAARLRQAALNTASQMVEDAYQRYQRRLQSGEFDATQALELAGKQSATNLRNAMGQSLTSLRNLGYREGDSPFASSQRRLSERALMDEQAQRLALQQQYQDREQQALGYYDAARQNQANMMLGQSGQVYAQAPQGGNMANTLAALGRAYGKPKSSRTGGGTQSAGVAPIGTTYGTDNYGNPVSIIPDNSNLQYPWEQ